MERYLEGYKNRLTDGLRSVIVCVLDGENELVASFSGCDQRRKAAGNGGLGGEERPELPFDKLKVRAAVGCLVLCHAKVLEALLVLGAQLSALVLTTS